MVVVDTDVDQGHDFGVVDVSALVYGMSFSPGSSVSLCWGKGMNTNKH